jgi:ABC-type sugar transport system substrate-binding protein
MMHLRRVGVRYRAGVLVTGAVSAVVLAAGCSSSGSPSSAAGAASTGGAGVTSGSTSSAASGQAACVAAADSYVKPYETIPTALPADFTPLASPPKPGGSIIRIVNGSIPTDVESGKQYAAIAKSFGWTGSYIVDNGSVEDLNAKFQEAISQHPTVIVMDGNPLSSVAQSVAAAKAAGIVVVLGSVVDEPESVPGFGAGENGGPVYTELGVLQANLFMRASNCTGAVAVIGLNYPVLNAGIASFQSTVKAKCPGCSVYSASLPAADIGTQAGVSQVVSLLQSHPNIKYVYSIIAPMVDGLVPALNQVGIQGVQIFGQTPDNQAIAALQNGTNAWWLTQSADLDSWMTTYAALRAIEEKKPVELKSNPVAILTPQNVPKGITIPPTYPANYAALFEKLWQASS